MSPRAGVLWAVFLTVCLCVGDGRVISPCSAQPPPATPGEKPAPKAGDILGRLAARYRAGQSPDFARWGPTTDDLDAESHPDGTVRYRLRSRIDGVGDREGVVRLHVDEIADVLEKTADVLTAAR